ncbi:bifunctional 4-hydroxy-2-oxoglutarate aldolase/2-dehydro-3-deoxy-phosphogluconate aldolase [Deinococcus marmoris]|uniref:4-Hydroxy-2-oxoglutarate aldolase n=1 Tax=Deinococcus marmoris TaxID=249408 RepID=A0A1U7P103_9DEIO|nr:bifunctional 4-hydroxy-2-oxoglutarate aldolase/2-dehydro-3-deoxy-phosphogluconate aldolase [Deinococcus marmoris]OLV18855.1 4-Hydroxy-2-oxoglutarate aldolase [Deinococcus marmoris]
MTRPDLTSLIERHRLIAILRGVPPVHAPVLARQLHAAGIRLLEVAFSDEHGEPGLRSIQALGLPGMHLGAGTVTTLERAEAARQAGAGFVLTPHLVPQVNAYAAEHGLGLISGAMTPTEIMQAREQGSEVVKLFPAGDLGAGYVKSLLGPYPDLKLLVVGGVDASNLPGFIQAGAVGAGIGGSLTRADWNTPDWTALDLRARELIALVSP